jgi:hypothetical protein
VDAGPPQHTARISQATIEKAIEERTIDWDLLMAIAESTLHRDEGTRGFAERVLNPAENAFKERWGGSVGLFPPVGGIHIKGNGEIAWTFKSAEIHFDWAEAWPLSYEIEVLAEEAREWWPEEGAAEGQGFLARIRRYFRKVLGSAGSQDVRRSHSNRPLDWRRG